MGKGCSPKGSLECCYLKKEERLRDAQLYPLVSMYVVVF